MTEAQRRDLLAELWIQGAPVEEIVRRTGYANANTVYVTAADLGLPRRFDRKRRWVAPEPMRAAS